MNPSDSDLDYEVTRSRIAAERKFFGRYTLQRELGRGGMGLVWLALDEKLDEQVALKFLPDLVARDREAIAELKDETLCCRKLRHPGIVAVYGFEEEAGAAAIVMEYVDGATLSDLKIEQPGRFFEVAQIQTLVSQLCDALDYAHRDARLVHRDIKPRNLMLGADGRLKLMDFGLARTVADSLSRVSVKNAASGTPPYMSPQQIAGRSATVADDIYALGATLYDLLTGKPPFLGVNIYEQVKSEIPPRVSERRAELGIGTAPIPHSWDETIAACLAKDPSQRPQSAGELAQRLSGTRQVIQPVPQAVASVVATPVAAASAPVPQFDQAAVPKVIKFECPHCGQRISATAKEQGQPGRCPECAKGFMVPREQGEAGMAKEEGPQEEQVETAQVPEVAPSLPAAPEKAEKVEIIWKSVPEDPQVPEVTRSPHNKSVFVTTVILATMLVGVAGWWFGIEAPKRAETARVARAPASATKEKPFVNSLGMEFVPVPGTAVLFCRTKTRVKDFRAYAREAGYVQRGGIYVMKVNKNADGSYGQEWEMDPNASWESPRFAQGPEHPVVGVSWEEANAFCAWLTKHDRAAGVLPAGASYRLPGDEEWSRAVGTGKYPWGNAFPPPRDAGNYGDAAYLKLLSSLSGGTKWSGGFSEVNDGYERTSPVGSFAANRLGIFDLGGNACEWCRDEYRASMNDADVLEKDPVLKVERASDGTPYRVLRGGSCHYAVEIPLRSSSRNIGHPTSRNDYIGFRCVLVISGG